MFAAYTDSVTCKDMIQCSNWSENFIERQRVNKQQPRITDVELTQYISRNDDCLHYSKATYLFHNRRYFSNFDFSRVFYHEQVLFPNIFYNAHNIAINCVCIL